jgi:hypothetical protein
MHSYPKLQDKMPISGSFSKGIPDLDIFQQWHWRDATATTTTIRAVKSLVLHANLIQGPVSQLRRRLDSPEDMVQPSVVRLFQTIG